MIQTRADSYARSKHYLRRCDLFANETHDLQVFVKGWGLEYLHRYYHKRVVKVD